MDVASKDATWKWTEIHQTAFEKLKKIIACEVLLIYPNFNDKFIIHTDASATKLDASIKTRYTISSTQQELIGIMVTLKELKNMY